MGLARKVMLRIASTYQQDIKHLDMTPQPLSTSAYNIYSIGWQITTG